jgi:hypothetical protein
MRRDIYICSLIIAALLLFASGASAAPYQHPATGLVFPDRLASMQKDKVTDYEKDNPGLGVGIGYNSPGITLTIYVYNYGIKSLPGSPDDPAIRQHFAQVVGDVMTMGLRGRYIDLVKSQETEVVLGSSPTGPKALSASFSYVQNNVERLSKLYLTSYKNHFVKVRYTYNKGVHVRAENTLRQLLEELAVMFQK